MCVTKLVNSNKFELRVKTIDYIAGYLNLFINEKECKLDGNMMSHSQSSLEYLFQNFRMNV